MADNEQEELIPENFRSDLINHIILPSYKRDVEYAISTRSRWSSLSTICLTMSILFSALSSVLSFTAAASNDSKNTNISLCAGISGILSIVFGRFASFCNGLDHVKTIQVNEMLDSLGITIKLTDTSKLVDIDDTATGKVGILDGSGYNDYGSVNEKTKELQLSMPRSKSLFMLNEV